MQGLRRLRQRIRQGRGLRHRGPEAARRRGSRRRPHLGDHPRFGAEPGRGEPGSDGSERGGAGTSDPGGARASRGRAVGHRLPGDARHRHRGRRPDRDQCDGGGLRARARRGSPAADRLGEDQHRPSGVRGRGRGADQDRARDESRGHPQASPLPQPESGDGLGAAPIAGDVRLDTMARPWGTPAAGGRERVRMVGHERPCRAGGIHLAGRCRARAPRWERLDRRSSAADRRFNPGVRRAATVEGRACPAGDSSAAALRKVGRGASRRGGTLSRMARRTWRCARGRERGVRSPALRHGLVGRHRPEPLRPSDRSGVPGRGVAARGSAGDRRDGRGAGIAQGDDRGVRLYRAGQPVARHGRGALRKRAGGTRGTRPVRRGARGRARRFPARRDVRPARRRGRPGRSAVETAGDLRARMRPRGAVVEPRHPAGRGARTQPGRDRGRAHRGRVQPGGRLAPRGGAGGR